MRRQNGLIENCEFQCKKKKMQETAKICNFQLKIVNFVATVSSLTGIPLQEAKASRVFLYLVCFPGVLFRLDFSAALLFAISESDRQLHGRQSLKTECT